MNALQPRGGFASPHADLDIDLYHVVALGEDGKYLGVC